MPNCKPILFNAEMVRAILEGRKTQTRRVITPQPHECCMFSDPTEVAPYCTGAPEKGYVYYKRIGGMWNSSSPFHAPYQPGDVLWVRETFALCQVAHERFRMDGATYTEISDGYAAYKADGYESIEELREETASDVEGFRELFVDGDRWRPSIHMPKWACRLWLEVTDVRAQRLHEISVLDAYAEGFDPNLKYPEIGFISLWDSLAKPGAIWDENPWVWAYTFKIIERPEGWPNA